MPIFLALAAVMAAAQAAPPALPPPAFGRDLITKRFIDQAVGAALSQFRTMALGRDAITAADWDLVDRIAAASARASVVQNILPNDLNGDGVVDRDEAVAVIARRERTNRMQMAGTDMNQFDSDRAVEDQVDQMMGADANSDGKIDIVEMLAFEGWRRQDYFDRDSMLRWLAGLDDDGSLTAADTERLMRAAFATIDSDEDGRISDGEAATYTAAVRDREVADARATRLANFADGPCTWPGLTPGASVIVVTSPGGPALSTVTIAGQDTRTSVAAVTVQAGDAPLSLLLSSETPTIWSFSGAVDRLASVSVVSGQGWRPGGVTGLPADKVVILPNGQCLPASLGRGAPDLAAEANRIIVAKAGAGDVRTMTLAYRLNLTVPGGETSKGAAELPLPPGSDLELWNEVVDDSPGGIISLDPKAVISRSKVEPYEVLPGWAGLDQLVRGGVLVVDRSSYFGVKNFSVRQPMSRYPGTIGDLLAVTYRQPASFPLPAGKIYRSCLRSAETNAILDGSAGACELASRKDPP